MKTVSMECLRNRAGPNLRGRVGPAAAPRHHAVVALAFFDPCRALSVPFVGTAGCRWKRRLGGCVT